MPKATRTTARMYARRRRAAVLLLLLLTIAVCAIGRIVRDDDPVETGAVTPAAPAPSTATMAATTPVTASSGSAAPSTVPAGAAYGLPSAAAVPPVAAGFTVVVGYGPVLGSAGPVRRFRVAVEQGLAADDFAAETDRILGDRRSWIAARQFRLQRVPPATVAEFTVYLASAATSERMCADGGLRTEGYTSCRLPDHVIINNDRWGRAVPGYGAPLAVYRAYAINHEVGHQLGHGHESCPRRGAPAPVMMQQTYGLRGCVANSWPYPRGKRYAGNPVD